MPGFQKWSGNSGKIIFDIVILSLKKEEVGKVAAVLILFNKLISNFKVHHGVLGDGDTGEGKIEIWQEPKGI